MYAIYKRAMCHLQLCAFPLVNIFMSVYSIFMCDWNCIQNSPFSVISFAFRSVWDSVVALKISVSFHFSFAAYAFITISMTTRVFFLYSAYLYSCNSLSICHSINETFPFPCYIYLFYFSIFVSVNNQLNLVKPKINE